MTISQFSDLWKNKCMMPCPTWTKNSREMQLSPRENQGKKYLRTTILRLKTLLLVARMEFARWLSAWMENAWSFKRNRNRMDLPNRWKQLLVSRLSSHKKTSQQDQFPSRNQMEPRAPRLPKMKLQKPRQKLSRTKTRPKNKTLPKIKMLPKIPPKMIPKMQLRHPKMWFIT